MIRLLEFLNIISVFKIPTKLLKTFVQFAFSILKSVSANGAHRVPVGPYLSFHKIVFNFVSFSNNFKLVIRSSTDYIFP